MSVDSYLELFTTMYGWAFAAIIRDVLVATGVVYLPFIMLVVSTWMEAHQSASVEGADAGWMIRKMEIEIGSAIFVLAMCFTTIPLLTVSQVSLNYTPDKTQLEPAPTTVTGGSPGSTYGTAFGSVPGTVEVPPWWFTIMGLSSGFNQAITTGIGSNVSGFRQLEEMARLATIEDPVLRGQLQRFAKECWVPARSKYLASTTPLGVGAGALSTYGETDPEWIGSHVFQDEPGYYDTMAATSEVSGFAVDPVQDADVAGSAQPPDNGRPTCNQWWTKLKNDTVAKLTLTGGVTFASKVTALVTAPGGDIDDSMVRLAIAKHPPNFLSVDDALGADKSGSISQTIWNGLGVIGIGWDSTKAQASKMPTILFGLMAQPLVLMAIYMFLPLIVVFSRYSLQVMFLGALAIFTVKFWAAMWFIARWLDDALIKGMYPDAGTLLGQFLQNSVDGVLKRVVLNTLLVGLYVGLPLVWTGMMSWAGMMIMRSVADVQESAMSGGADAGKKGVDMTRRGMSK